MNIKYGLALAGGGIKGASHIGALKVFEEKRIPINCIAGTSSGSIVAALYAIGYTADELKEIFIQYEAKKKYPWSIRPKAKKKLVDIDYAGCLRFFLSLVLLRKNTLDGFVKGDQIRNMMKELCIKKNCVYFSDCKIPLAIPAVDLRSGSQIIFAAQKYYDNVITDVPIWDAVRASIAFPGVFQPFQYKNYYLIDGGLLDNNPVEILGSLGSTFNISFEIGRFKNIDHNSFNFFSLFERCINILRHKYEELTDVNIDFTLTSDIKNIGLLDVKKISRCIEYGYETANQALNGFSCTAPQKKCLNYCADC